MDSHSESQDRRGLLFHCHRPRFSWRISGSALVVREISRQRRRENKPTRNRKSQLASALAQKTNPIGRRCEEKTLNLRMHLKLLPHIFLLGPALFIVFLS